MKFTLQLAEQTISEWVGTCGGIDQIHKIRSRPAINKIGSGLDALIIFCVQGFVALVDLAWHRSQT